MGIVRVTMLISQNLFEVKRRRKQRRSFPGLRGKGRGMLKYLPAVLIMVFPRARGDGEWNLGTGAS